jgi:hypothetical protein
MIEFYKFAAVDVAAEKKAGFFPSSSRFVKSKIRPIARLILSFRVQENLFFAVTE